MSTYCKTHSVPVIAAAALTAFRFIASSGLHASSSNDVLGVSETAAAADRACRCITHYSALVEAAQALADGDFVKPAADGSGRAALGSGADACGRAVGSAVTGALIEVRLMPEWGLRMLHHDDVADETEMLALSGVKASDTCHRLDTDSDWRCSALPSDDAANWYEVASAGNTGDTAGTLPQFGAIRAVEDWQKYSVTADGIVINGPCIVKGFRCLTGTSIVGVYDALSAAGTNLMPSVTTAANTEYLLAGEGGVLFSTGLYVDWGSGIYIFYARPAGA